MESSDPVRGKVDRNHVRHHLRSQRSERRSTKPKFGDKSSTYVDENDQRRFKNLVKHKLPYDTITQLRKVKNLILSRLRQ